MLSRVDLPDPEAPIMETSSPLSTWRLIPFSTWRGTAPGYVLLISFNVIINVTGPLGALTFVEFDVGITDLVAKVIKKFAPAIAYFNDLP